MQSYIERKSTRKVSCHVTKRDEHCVKQQSTNNMFSGFRVAKQRKFSIVIFFTSQRTKYCCIFARFLFTNKGELFSTEWNTRIKK